MGGYKGHDSMCSASFSGSNTGEAIVYFRYNRSKRNEVKFIEVHITMFKHLLVSKVAVYIYMQKTILQHCQTTHTRIEKKKRKKK